MCILFEVLEQSYNCFYEVISYVLVTLFSQEISLYGDPVLSSHIFLVTHIGYDFMM